MQRRFYDVISGPLHEALLDCKRTNDKANEEYKKILEKVGAESTYYVRDRKLIAMIFDKPPLSKHFKRVPRTQDGWYPKVSSKEGRALHEELSAIKTKRAEDCLSVVGIENGYITEGCRISFVSVTVVPSDPPRFFLLMPFYEEDPEVIATYKKEKEEGACYNNSLEMLLWEPPEGIVEMKEWEVKKAIEEWNEGLKE